jgi:hypothetical protein
LRFFIPVNQRLTYYQHPLCIELTLGFHGLTFKNNNAFFFFFFATLMSLIIFGYGREFACRFSFKMTSKNNNQVGLQMKNVAWYSRGLMNYMLLCPIVQEPYSQ